MTFLVCNPALFCHSCMNRNPVLVSIGNQQSAIGNVVISPLTFILSPQGLSITHIFIYIIRSRYILIFEENYGRFVALSILLTPNFNALLNPI